MPARPARDKARPTIERPKVFRQPKAVLVSATVVSAAAAMLFNLMPALLAAVAVRFGLSDGQIGAVGSSYLMGFAIVACTSNLWIDRFNWRHIVASAAAVSVTALAACAIVNSLWALLAVLTIVGCGLGSLYTVCTAVVSENHRPDQAFGIKLAGEVALAIVALFILTTFVIDRWGFSGVVMTFSGITALAALYGLRGLPVGREFTPPEKRFAMARRDGETSPILRDWAPWLGLSALFVSFAGVAALWAFVSQLAPTFGVSTEEADGVLTTALIVSGVAGVAAAFLGDRVGRATPLAFGMALAIAGVATLGLGKGLSAYFIGVVLAGGCWNFPLAYQMGMIASADGRGNVAVLMPAAIAVGGALGPVIAGSLIATANGYMPLYAFFAVAATVGLAAFVVLGRRLASGER
ncbi:MFS transporter [Hyphomonas sp.]|uniref:MFS transporter n=1 Tax=Hyphomonas sp. TaxID=87 RepID=UPI0032427620